MNNLTALERVVAFSKGTFSYARRLADFSGAEPTGDIKEIFGGPKLSSAQINALLDRAQATAPHASLWRHKKGGTYQVLCHAFCTLTNEAVVVYTRLAGPDFNAEEEASICFSRPISQWTPDRFARLVPITGGSA